METVTVRWDLWSNKAEHTYVPSGWLDMYWNLLALLEDRPLRKDDVERMTSQAMGYVWGWQDRGGYAEKDSGIASDFAYAYGVTVAEMELGRTHARMPIQDAWRSWRKLGRIDRDWRTTDFV